MTFYSRNGMLYVRINSKRLSTKMTDTVKNRKLVESYYRNDEFFNKFEINKQVPTVLELCEEVLKQKEKTFEMRIVDDRGRRYKWSTTEISCSPETLNIVSQDRAEKRTLYTDEYSNGMKIEYIGN